MASETDPAVLVLASLAGEPRHGYAITQDIANSVGVVLGPGTLYGVLARLGADGLIEALPAQGCLRPYWIACLGQRTLAEQAEQMQRVADLGLRRLRAAGATP